MIAGANDNVFVIKFLRFSANSAEMIKDSVLDK